MCECECVCVCACMHACVHVHACVCACVHVCVCTNTKKFVLTAFWFFAFAMGYVLQFGERAHKQVHYGSDTKTDTGVLV